MANVTVPVIFNETYVSRILDGVDFGVGKKIIIHIQDQNDPGLKTASWSYSYEKKSNEETNIEYGSRFFGAFLRAFVRAVEFRNSQDVREAALAAIPAASVDVPDEIVVA